MDGMDVHFAQTRVRPIFCQRLTMRKGGLFSDVVTERGDESGFRDTRKLHQLFSSIVSFFFTSRIPGIRPTAQQLDGYDSRGRIMLGSATMFQ